jgi:transglutaminase-like putative cysteine protease
MAITFLENDTNIVAFFFGSLAFTSGAKVLRELYLNKKIERYARANLNGAPVKDLYNAILRDFKYEWIKDEKGVVIQQTAGEVFKRRRGVCWDFSNLLYVMYNSVGIPAKFIWVNVDQDGDKVAHVCLQVKLNGSDVLVDPVYKTVNARHKVYSSCSSLNLAFR